MKRLPQWLLLLLVAMLAACATGPRITSDQDPNADFSRYRTFAFYSPLAVESKGYSTPSSALMRDAARREMEARGYVYSEQSPDLLVNINAYLQEKQDVVGGYGPMYYGAYYGYRGPYWGGPLWYDYPYVREYTEGTMNVDLVDAKHSRLVWEGIAVGRMNRMGAAERAARINGTMAEIFLRFPHRAGGG
jgi:hypothetical protein